MNISHLSSLPIGHAVELTVTVPPEFVAWHVRRRHDDLFPLDALDLTDCVLIHAEEGAPCERITHRPLLDTADVQHGIPYYYQACGYNGTDWIASPTRVITPTIRARNRSVDPLTLLRDRLIFGLGDAVSAGVLHPHTGRIPVLTAPPQADSTAWPLVTLHLESDTSAERYIGETLDHDRHAIDGTWWETEGWFSRSEIRVIGWSQNPDERQALRLTLKRLVVGNLPVFAAHGLITPEWSQQDSEDFSTYNAPVYQTLGTFTCLAPTALTWPEPAIASITVHHHDHP